LTVQVSHAETVLIERRIMRARRAVVSPITLKEITQKVAREKATRAMGQARDEIPAYGSL
jgi:hypothetical protein